MKWNPRCSLPHHLLPPPLHFSTLGHHLPAHLSDVYLSVLLHGLVTMEHITWVREGEWRGCPQGRQEVIGSTRTVDQVSAHRFSIFHKVMSRLVAERLTCKLGTLYFKFHLCHELAYWWPNARQFILPSASHLQYGVTILTHLYKLVIRSTARNVCKVLWTL